jgi:glucosamine kinase
LANAIVPWLTPDLRGRLKPPDGDGVAGALLVARRRFGAAGPEGQREAVSGSPISNA